MSTYDRKDVKTSFGQNAYQTLVPGVGYVDSFIVAQGWQRRNTFKSADNLLWGATHLGSWRYDEQALARLKRLDAGNGLFFKEDASLSQLTLPNKTIDGRQGYGYTGPVLPTTSEIMRSDALSLVSWPTEQQTSDVLFGLGGTAISRTIPEKSLTSLATLLGELRKEGIPKIVSFTHSSGNRPQLDAGGSYLNWEFGWAPIIRDVTDILVAVRDSRRILEEYNKVFGSHIRRRYEFPIEEKTINWVSPNRAAYPAQSNLYVGTGTGNVTYSGTYVSRAWFSGAFRFANPIMPTWHADFDRWEREANRLLGTRITPELLWNLTGWTWLFDWMANIGDVISNISYLGSDGLTLHYGYIMRQIRMELRVTGSVGMTTNSGGIPACTFVLEQKARKKASPYGFGLNPESFTPKQWSILAALGTSRAQGKLL